MVAKTIYRFVGTKLPAIQIPIIYNYSYLNSRAICLIAPFDNIRPRAMPLPVNSLSLQPAR